VSYADTIVRLKTERGEIAISAFKIKRVEQAGADVEISYTLSDNPAELPRRVTVRQPLDNVYDAWMRGLRAWDGQ